MKMQKCKQNKNVGAVVIKTKLFIYDLQFLQSLLH